MNLLNQYFDLLFIIYLFALSLWLATINNVFKQVFFEKNRLAFTNIFVKLIKVNLPPPPSTKIRKERKNTIANRNT